MATDTRTFGTQADDNSTGATAWSNPSNAAASDDSRATAALSPGGNSHYHKSTNSSHASGTALSSGDTVTQIKYRFEKRKSSSGNIRDWKIYPVEGGSIVTTTNFADTGTDWGTTDATAEYTQTTNLPSADTILASNWGVVIACQNTNGFSATGELDYVEAIVTFSVNTAIIPSTLALTLTPFAPTIRLNKFVQPSVLALALTTFAPSIVLGGPQTVIPGTLAIVLGTFAPTVTATNNQRVSPSTVALVTAAFAPLILAPRVARPSTFALALTTFAPTLTVQRKWQSQRLTLHGTKR